MRNYNKKNVVIDEAAVSQLEKAMRETKNLRMYKRYSVVLKHLKGFTNRQIAEMECLEEHAVGNYIKKFKCEGLDGLAMKPIPGSKRILNPSQELKLVDVVTNNTPDEVGFEGRKNWTIKLIRQWTMKNFDVIIQHSSMAVILHRLNLSYTRPTYVLKKASKEKQDEFKLDFEKLKKIP